MNYKTFWGTILMLFFLPGIARSQQTTEVFVARGITISEVSVAPTDPVAEKAPSLSPVIATPAANAVLMTVSQSTSLRRGPGASFLVIKRMRPGYELQPISDFGEQYWMNVHYADTTGWVKKALLKELETPVKEATPEESAALSAGKDPALSEAAYTETTTQVIGPDYSTLPPFSVYRETSLRAQPANHAKAIKRLPQGAKVKVIDPRSERLWTKILYQDQVGWARKDLLDPIE